MDLHQLSKLSQNTNLDDIRLYKSHNNPVSMLTTYVQKRLGKNKSKIPEFYEHGFLEFSYENNTHNNKQIFEIDEETGKKRPTKGTMTTTLNLERGFVAYRNSETRIYDPRTGMRIEWYGSQFTKFEKTTDEDIYRRYFCRGLFYFVFHFSCNDNSI